MKLWVPSSVFEGSLGHLRCCYKQKRTIRDLGGLTHLPWLLPFSAFLFFLLDCQVPAEEGLWVLPPFYPLHQDFPSRPSAPRLTNTWDVSQGVSKVCFSLAGGGHASIFFPAEEPPVIPPRPRVCCCVASRSCYTHPASAVVASLGGRRDPRVPAHMGLFAIRGGPRRKHAGQPATLTFPSFLCCVLQEGGLHDEGIMYKWGSPVCRAMTLSACCCVEALFPRRHGRGPGLLLSFPLRDERSVSNCGNTPYPCQVGSV